MSNPETHQPTPEERQESQQQAETPERPLDEVQKERDVQHEAQEERNAQEKAEHQEEEQSAEEMLEKEMMLETYAEMKNGLQGDSREVFDAVDGALSEQERMDLARVFTKFMDVSDQEYAVAAENVRNIPKEEYLANARANRDTYLQQCFQNSIDFLVEKIQSIEEDAPRNDAERLSKAVNEKANEAAHSQETPAERAAWKKVRTLATSYIAESKQRDPSRVFRGQERPPATQDTARSSSRLDAAADIYEAFNLVDEVRDAKAMGIDIAIRDEQGQELIDPQIIAKTTPVHIDVAVPNGLTSTDVKIAMGTGIQTIRENGERQLFTGDLWRMEQGVEKIQSALKKKESERASS